MNTTQLAKQAQPFPLMRTAGPFLLLLGVSMVVGTLLGGRELVNRPIFFAGAGVGIAALFALADRLSFGPPTRGQLAALIGAILLEVILLVALGHAFPHAGARGVWLRTLLVVGLHFLPMAVAFGPRIAVLGLLCLLNAALGLALAQVPFLVFGLLDGVLKASFGIALLLARPARI